VCVVVGRQVNYTCSVLLHENLGSYISFHRELNIVIIMGWLNLFINVIWCMILYFLCLGCASINLFQLRLLTMVIISSLLIF
jgi:hypothetical protein